ncbi:DNA polymerase III subunit gamma/tau [Babesia caballi]|uniref:DNA polymerase III subunit gamma/tau n=1 Tax=Babesia caballi TaxID=5871 RepID=A0AAV4LR07_BABCB|nr:DNA polymerase III subunit gamma/tau [Babesia caballi]
MAQGARSVAAARVATHNLLLLSLDLADGVLEHHVLVPATHGRRLGQERVLAEDALALGGRLQRLLELALPSLLLLALDLLQLAEQHGFVVVGVGGVVASGLPGGVVVGVLGEGVDVLVEQLHGVLEREEVAGDADALLQLALGAVGALRVLQTLAQHALVLARLLGLEFAVCRGDGGAALELHVGGLVSAGDLERAKVR